MHFKIIADWDRRVEMQNLVAKMPDKIMRLSKLQSQSTVC